MFIEEEINKKFDSLSKEQLPLLNDLWEWDFSIFNGWYLLFNKGEAYFYFDKSKWCWGGSYWNDPKNVWYASENSIKQFLMRANRFKGPL